MSESTAPVLGNLFTPEFINDPYPTYRLIRETNPQAPKRFRSCWAGCRNSNSTTSSTRSGSQRLR